MTATDPLHAVPVMRLSLSGATIVTREDFDGIGGKLARLRRLVLEDAAYFDDGGDARGALHLGHLHEAAPPLARLAAAHAARLARLDYRPEPEEILEGPAHVWTRGGGDCEDHAVTGAAIVEAFDRVASRAPHRPSARYAWALVTMGGTREEPAHCSLLVAAYEPGRPPATPPEWLAPFTAAPAGWHYSDTSEPADFGEEPYHAAVRLDPTIGRTDIDERTAPAPFGRPPGARGPLTTV